MPKWPISVSITKLRVRACRNCTCLSGGLFRNETTRVPPGDSKWLHWKVTVFSPSQIQVTNWIARSVCFNFIASCVTIVQKCSKTSLRILNFSYKMGPRSSVICLGWNSSFVIGVKKKTCITILGAHLVDHWILPKLFLPSTSSTRPKRKYNINLQVVFALIFNTQKNPTVRIAVIPKPAFLGHLAGFPY